MYWHSSIIQTINIVSKIDKFFDIIYETSQTYEDANRFVGIKKAEILRIFLAFRITYNVFFVSMPGYKIWNKIVVKTFIFHYSYKYKRVF